MDNVVMTKLTSIFSFTPYCGYIVESMLSIHLVQTELLVTERNGNRVFLKRYIKDVNSNSLTIQMPKTYSLALNVQFLVT